MPLLLKCNSVSVEFTLSASARPVAPWSLMLLRFKCKVVSVEFTLSSSAKRTTSVSLNTQERLRIVSLRNEAEAHAILRQKLLSSPLHSEINLSKVRESHRLSFTWTVRLLIRASAVSLQRAATMPHVNESTSLSSSKYLLLAASMSTVISFLRSWQQR